MSSSNEVEVQPGSERRVFVQVGSNTLETIRSGRPSVFLKTPDSLWSGHPEHPHNQASMYWNLSKYLQVPDTKLFGKFGISTRLMTYDQRLVVQRVQGERYDQALLSSPDRFTLSGRRFIEDLARMWKETKSDVATNPVFSEDIKQDMRKEPTDTIHAFLSSPETQQFLDMPLMINGVNYPKLRELCQGCVAKLKDSFDPVVTRGHGDEHFGNLFVVDKGGKPDYKIIDPRRRLFWRSPATTVNTFLGSFLLFVFDYESKLSVTTSENGNGVLGINYEVARSYQDSLERVLSLTHGMLRALDDLEVGNFLTKEYLFANLLRSYIGRVAPKNREKSAKNRDAHLAMAVELYTDLDSFLRR